MIKVLLVEDDEAHAELIRIAFEPRADRMSLTVARGLEEARRELAESVPDLVLTDFLLPDGEGLELLPSEDAQARYPVVILTSYGDDKVAGQARAAGAWQYVVKSATTLAEMPEIVEEAISAWRNRASA